VFDPGEDLLAPDFIDLYVNRDGVLFSDVRSGSGWQADRGPIEVGAWVDLVSLSNQGRTGSTWVE
jgi:hypothetical protein